MTSALSEAERLEPCPFCGADNVRVYSDYASLSFVGCNNCGAEGPVKEDRAESRAAWNRRAA